jgi:hypothetical protein
MATGHFKILSLILISLSIGWVDYPPMRQVSNNTVLSDIESHLPKNNIYTARDTINQVHEGTHGINSILRQKYRSPAFYCLNNKAFVFSGELDGTISSVAARIPIALRGEVYDLYLVKQQKDWNNRPSYLFDELTAYINGSVAWEQLGKKERSETIKYALELAIYCAFTNQSNDSKIFWGWQVERIIGIYNQSGLHFDYCDSSEFKSIISIKKTNNYIFW